MKRSIFINLAVLTAFMLLIGCITTPVTQSISNVTGGKKADPGDYRKVPAALRGDVKEAEFDLKQADQYMKHAEEKVKFTELKVEKAALEKKYAEYNQELAKIVRQKSEAIVALRKAEAVDNAGLGDKEANIKQIANLKTKELNITTAEIKTTANLDTTRVKLKKLDKKIRAQAKKTGKAGGYAKVNKKRKKGRK